jgi:uncharacterized membrane protein
MHMVAERWMAFKQFSSTSTAISRIVSGLRRKKVAHWVAATGLILAGTSASHSQQLQTLRSHVRTEVSDHSAALVGYMPSDQQIRATLVLPLRNTDALTSLLSRLYNPSSPDYRHFLTTEQFTEQFGPTTEDFQTVVAFARANGLTVAELPANRLVVPVAGSVSQLNAAFHVQMNLYQHPSENRVFFSPDREPSLSLAVPIAHISGLDNFSLPHPMVVRRPSALQLVNGQQPSTVNGSGPGSSYLGSDIRAAYYGGSTLDGTGQTVGLLEFGGYNLSDVNLTFSNAGQTYKVPINNVLIDGATGAPSGNDDAEEVLDIVQVIGMAPNLSQVRVYIGTSSDADILNSMASENLAKQISCSWSWKPADPTTDDVFFEEMAAQGQTFFAASGDSGAYDAAISAYFYPADDQYVTAVGGTHLTTTGPGGAWVSETVWNSNNAGSGGGISPDGIPIPSWQVGLATTANGGSATLRNVPDVAMEGDFDNYNCDLGSCSGDWAGTSFAAPRWAGFAALVNQQAVEAGTVPTGGLGFINPALYRLAQGAESSGDFHDITVGNNDTDNQPVWFSAEPGYDLTTGWGSANGQSLINDLAGPQVPGFWLASTQSAITVNPGSTANATLNITGAGGFTGSVTFAVSSTLPSGVTASFAPNPTATSSVLTLTANSSAPNTTQNVTVTGTSGNLSATTNFTVAVHTPSFTLAASPASVSANQGAAGTTTISVLPLYGFNSSVTLSIAGLPAGVTAAFSPTSTTGSSTLTLTSSSTTTPGTYPLTITGTSGNLTISTPLSLTVVGPSFTLSGGYSVAIGQGSTGTTYVSVYAQNGFSGSVTLAASGLPAGVTASFSPNPTTGSSTVTFTSSSIAATGQATITITGTSGSLTATTTIALSVFAPTFTLSSIGYVSIGQGTSSTASVFVNPQYGFTGSVNLSVTGLPTGVTASFSPNPTTGNSVLTLVASSSASTGQYSATITGISGSLTATTTLTFAVYAPTFTLATYSTVTLGQGTSSSTTVYITPQYGFTGSVNLTLSGLPTGVTGSFSPNPTTNSSTLTLTASSSAPSGQYNITINGTSGHTTATTTLNLTVAAPTFTLGSYGSISIGQGTTAQSNVQIYGQNGFTGNVTLSASGLPAGITASFSPNPTTSSSTLTLTASSTAALGQYNLTVTGSSGGATATTILTLGVYAPTFTLSGINSLTISQAGNASSSIYVTGQYGFSGAVSFSISGLPSGVTASFLPNTTTYATSLTLGVAANAPLGTSTITVTGNSGTQSQTLTFPLSIVAPSFTLSSSPSSLTLNQGSSDPVVITVQNHNGFAGAVTLSVSGLPTGVTASFSPNPPPVTSTLTLSASASAAPGTTTITITGTNGSTTATTSIALSVLAPTFTISAAPAAITMFPGAKKTSLVASVGQNGFAGNVNYTVTGLPTGVTATFIQNPSSTSNTLTLAAASNAPLGTATATITGISGAIAATTTITIAIRSAPPPSATSLAVTSNGKPLTTVSSGTSITLTASVTAGSTPWTSGQVNFCDGTTAYCDSIHNVGSAQLTNSGTAALKLAPGPGNHLYRANFVGTNGIAGSTSNSVTVSATSSLASQTTITQSGTNGNYTLAATVSGNGPLAPAGGVSFLDTSNGNLGLGTATLSTSASTYSISATLNPTAVPYGDAMATGDFNGDGKPDLAILSSQNIGILLGNGDGTFQPAASLQASGSPTAIILGDFNRDGNLDIAITVGSTNSVSIFLGNGDGTFANSSSNPQTGNFPIALTVADFNGDGLLDLAAINNGDGTLTILLGKGDGTFNAVSQSVAVGFAPSSIATGDFNGDGVSDLAITLAESNTMTILLGAGDGTFSVSGNPPSGTFFASVAVGDFNGDGNADLVGGNGWASTITAFLGNGAGSFSIAPSAPTGTYPALLVVADFNGDGKLDVATANTYDSTISILLGNGDGSFTPVPNLEFSPATRGIAAGDWNSDGLPDLIFSGSSSGSLSLFVSQVSQTTTATITGISPLGTGQHLVDASFSGNSFFSASKSATTPLIAQKGPPTVTLTLAPAAFSASQSTTVSIAVGGGSANPVPTGTVKLSSATYTSASATLSGGATTITIPAGTLPIGTDPISATYSPDTPGSSTYTGATGTATATVQPYQTTTLFSRNPSGSVPPGQSVTLNFAVSRVGGAGIPTGTVTLSSGGATLGTFGLAAGSGSVVIPVPVGTPPGSYPMTALYNGDSSDQTSTATIAVVVIAPTSPTATTFTIAPTGTIQAGKTAMLTATVAKTSGTGTPTGTVTFSEVGFTLGTVTLVNGTASLSFPVPANAPTGTYTLTAAYNGDSTDQPSATSTQYTITPPVSATSTNFTIAPVGTIQAGKTAILTATVAKTSGTGTPSGSVTFTEVGVTLGTVNLVNGTATLSVPVPANAPAGTYTLTATYNGDAADQSSTSSVSYTITPAPYATSTVITINPGGTLHPGENITVTAKISRVGAAGTPTGSVILMNGNITVGTFPMVNGVATLSGAMPIGTPTGNYTFTANYTGDANDQASTATVNYSVSP